MNHSKNYQDSTYQIARILALKPITETLDRADVIILASPVYVYHVTGAMKAFLGHYATSWNGVSDILKQLTLLSQ